MSVMVITGGTAGAGKATALRFARAGYPRGADRLETKRVYRRRDRPVNGLALKRWLLAPMSSMPGAAARRRRGGNHPRGNRRLDQQRHDHRAGALSSDERGGVSPGDGGDLSPGT